MATGIAVEEIGRARDADVRYMRNTFPLLNRGWRRADCLTYLRRHARPAWGARSTTTTFWADLEHNSPAEWADAIAFDHAIRHDAARPNAQGRPLRG